MNNTPKPKRPEERCTISALVCTSCSFLLAVSRIQIKKIKHEAIGLVIVLVAPFTFLWIFPWKKIVLCGTISIHSLKFYWLYNILLLSAILLSCLFTGAVLIILCKQAVTRVENNTLQQQYRKAVRETIPFVVFVITHQVFSIEFVSVLSYQKYMTSDTGSESPDPLEYKYVL